MSGEEVVELLKEEMSELAEFLADGLESAYEELKEVLEDAGESKDEIIELLKEILAMMKDAGRITVETYQEIVDRIEGL